LVTNRRLVANRRLRIYEKGWWVNPDPRQTFTERARPAYLPARPRAAMHARRVIHTAGPGA
jgi:hypothetical protein